LGFVCRVENDGPYTKNLVPECPFQPDIQSPVHDQLIFYSGEQASADKEFVIVQLIPGERQRHSKESFSVFPFHLIHSNPTDFASAKES
jgi:hypothetical protein